MLIRQAVAQSGCGAGSAVRVKILFDGTGRVERVEGVPVGLECLGAALKSSLVLKDVTGGYVVVAVRWR